MPCLTRGRRDVAVTLVMLGLALAPQAARAAGANLLANPGFEESAPNHPWMPTAWDTSRAGVETVLFARDDFAAHTGKYGVSIANASVYLPFWHNWSQTIDVTPDMWGKDLVVSAWTRSNGLEGRAYLLVQSFRDTVGKMARVWKVSRNEAGTRLGLAGVNDPTVGLGWDRAPFDDRETDWVERRVRIYVAPSTNQVSIRLGIFGLGQVMFDDVSATLEEAAPAIVPPLNVNLLEDPGFEGNTLAWELSLPPFPPITAEKDTVTRAHSGKACMHFNCEEGIIIGKMGAGQVFCNRALSGKRVRMTAYAKAESLASQVYLHLYCHTGTTTRVQPSTPKVAGTQDWSPLVVEMDVPEDTYVVWAWIEYSAPIKGHVYVDDATFEVLGPATGAETPAALVTPKSASGKAPAGKTPGKTSGKTSGKTTSKATPH